MKYLTLILTVALTLSSCNSFSPQKENTFVIVHPDPVPTITMNNPKWSVLNQDQLKVLANNPSEIDSVWYLLDESQFMILMDNLLQISDKTKKQDINLLYYKDAIDKYNQSINK